MILLQRRNLVNNLSDGTSNGKCFFLLQNVSFMARLLNPTISLN